jgi:hypothetical protein
MESARLVSAIAQRLVLALPTAAKLDQRATVEIKFPAVLIKQFKIALDVDTPIALHHHSCRHSGSP